MLTYLIRANHAKRPFGTIDDGQAHFTIGRLILIAGFLTATLTVGVSGVIIHQQLDIYARMRQVIAFTNQAKRVGDLVDELQIERDLTALSLSGDARAVTALFRQYPRSDRKRGSADLVQIDRLRVELLQHSLTSSEAIEGYSAVIGSALAGVGDIAKSFDSNPVGAYLKAYRELTQAKERASQERAIGSVGFANAFYAGPYERFTELRTEQETYFASYLALVSEGRRQEFSRLMSGAELSEFSSLRSSAQLNGQAGTIDAGTWFVASSRKIETLRGIEEVAAADLLAVADETGRGAMMRLAATSLGSGFAVLVISALTLIMGLAQRATARLHPFGGVL
jgi:hypothetical protein